MRTPMRSVERRRVVGRDVEDHWPNALDPSVPGDARAEEKDQRGDDETGPSQPGSGAPLGKISSVSWMGTSTTQTLSKPSKKRR